MNFKKASKENQKIFLDSLSKEINNKKVLSLYYGLLDRFNEYCYGMKNSNNEFYTLVYYIPSKKPIVYPPLVLPSKTSNIDTQLTFTTSFIITKIKKEHNPEQIIFLFKENTKAGKNILSIKDINNGTLYNTDYYAVSGVISNELKNEYKNLFKEVDFKLWKDFGDDKIEKMLDLTFTDSIDNKIKSGIIKEEIRKQFKTKELNRNNGIIMGKEGKAIGLAFSKLDKQESNEEVIFGTSSYFGIVPKMRQKGYSNILFASILDNLIKLGANSYKGKVHKDNINAIKTFNKFGIEVYDSLMIINAID